MSAEILLIRLDEYLRLVGMLLIYSAVSGGLSYVIWKISASLLEKRGCTFFCYRGMVMVGFLFLVPPWPVFLAWRKIRKGGYIRRGHLFMQNTRFMVLFFRIAMSIWVLGFLIFLVRFLMDKRKCRQLRQISFPAKLAEKRALEKARKRVGIRREVKVLHLLGLRSPFVHGYVHPVIYLPERNLSDEELKIVLTHELTHVKHGDTFLIPVLMYIGVINWFMPFFYKLLKDYRVWAERACDENCLGFFPEEAYFGVILDLASDQNPEMNFTPALAENKNTVKNRICYRKSRMSRSKKGSLFTAAVLLTCCFSAVGLLHGSNLFLQKEYVDVAKQTAGTELDVSQEIHWVIPPSSNEADCEKCTFTLGPGETFESRPFMKSAGSSVAVQAFSDAGHYCVRAGIRNKVTERGFSIGGSDRVRRTFYVTETSEYCAFVTNTGMQPLHVTLLFQTNPGDILETEETD